MDERGNIVDKMLSLDMSTKSTGWAYFNEGKLINYGKIQVDDKIDWLDRITMMGDEIESILNEFSITHVVCEDVPLEKQ